MTNKFKTIKINFEVYFSIQEDREISEIRDQMFEKFSLKASDYCEDNSFGMAGAKIFLETQIEN